MLNPSLKWRIDLFSVFLVNDELLSLGRTYSLEDFFWTGSGDGPLPPPDNIGQNPIIKTTTILATVFLDASSTMTTVLKTLLNLKKKF